MGALQDGKSSNYTQGYSKYTTASHESRTADYNAAFLLPHIKKTDHILDIGCGPGTITTGFAKYVPSGSVIGTDVSPDVLKKAQTLAIQSNIPTEGPGSVIFEEGNVVEKLKYPDNTFDIVFSSQVFGHIPPPDLPLKALAEMRRVLKPGGILASRSAIEHHFYPPSCDLDRLWSANFTKILNHKSPEDPTGTILPSLLLKTGFLADKIKVGASCDVFSSEEQRKFLVWRAEGQLRVGDPFREKWIEAGISEEEIGETVEAARRWGEDEGAWYVAVQGEMLARK